MHGDLRVQEARLHMLRPSLQIPRNARKKFFLTFAVGVLAIAGRPVTRGSFSTPTCSSGKRGLNLMLMFLHSLNATRPGKVWRKAGLCSGQANHRRRDFRPEFRPGQ